MARFLAALFAVFSFANGANAQNCAPRERAVAILAERYAETPRMLGLDPRGAIVELFASDETGTWILLVTNPNLVSCIIATGDDFALVAAPPPGSDM